jgi:hypothetical protein
LKASKFLVAAAPAVQETFPGLHFNQSEVVLAGLPAVVELKVFQHRHRVFDGVKQDVLNLRPML